MCRISLVAVLLCSLVTVAAPVPNTTPQDAKAIVAKWVAVSTEYEGHRWLSTERRVTPRVEVREDSLTINNGQLAYPMRYTLDARKSPAHIDLVYTDGSDKGKSVKGLYELKGDSLKLCVAQPGEERPKALATKPGETFMLYNLVRSKPKE
jgi:uncharacterized protein (TIGR03067 family)